MYVSTYVELANALVHGIQMKQVDSSIAKKHRQVKWRVTADKEEPRRIVFQMLGDYVEDVAAAGQQMPSKGIY